MKDPDSSAEWVRYVVTIVLIVIVAIGGLIELAPAIGALFR